MKKMKDDQRWLSVIIPKELHKKFKRVSFEKDKTMKDMLTSFVEKTVEDFEKNQHRVEMNGKGFMEFMNKLTEIEGFNGTPGWTLKVSWNEDPFNKEDDGTYTVWDIENEEPEIIEMIKSCNEENWRTI